MLGGVIVLLTWLWLTAFIVLMGAELDSELERQEKASGTPLVGAREAGAPGATGETGDRTVAQMVAAARSKQ